MLGKRKHEEKPERNASAQKPYVGDYNGPLGGPKDAAAVGFPMIILALAVGFLVGAVVWAVLGLSNIIVNFLWHDVRSYVPFFWFPLALCTLGGIVIGVWTKLTHNSPAPLNTVMAEVKRSGGYRLDGVGKSVVSFLLPLAFGGSIGPEAGLTGLIAGACTWIGKTLKRAGLKIKSMTDLTISASLSAIFGTPFLGIVATAEDAIPNADEYTLRRSSKIVLYTAAAFGAFAGISFISAIPGMGSGLPRFGSITTDIADFFWIVPFSVAGWLLAIVFHTANLCAGKLHRSLGNSVILPPILCGVVIGALGTFLPDVLFAGEEQSTELIGTWTTLSATTLLLTGALKLVATPLCLNLGWHGGNFFPCIFAGISFGYGLAALTGVDPMLCVTVTTTALMAGIMRKPAMALALLILCFPIDGILWSGLAAILGAALPMPRAILPKPEAPDKQAASDSDDLEKGHA